MDGRYRFSSPADEPDAVERDTADRVPMAEPRRRSAANHFFACLFLLGWHSLVIIAFLDLVGQQSTLRVSWGNSPQEDMWIFGVQVAPGLLVTLLVGLILIRGPLARSRMNPGVVLGTVAAAPMLLFVATAAGLWSVLH